MIPRIFFSVDGSPVELADWSFSSSCNLGFDQMRAVATNARAKKIVGGIQQGSKLEAFTESGKRVWEGAIPQPPKLRQDGIATVAAQGHAYQALKSGNRITPIIDSPGAWVPANFAPVNYPLTCSFSADPSFTNTPNSRKITFSPANNGDEIGFAFYGRGMNITRFEATLDAPTAGSIWRVLTCRLPDTKTTAHIEMAGSSGDVSVSGMGSPFGRTFAAAVDFAPSDVVIVELYANTQGGTVPASQKNITNPRVWGDYDDDAIYTHHAAKIVARQLEWDDSGVTGKGAAPLTSSDWVGDGASYMNYISGLEDFCWGVWDDQGYGPLLTFGPYGRTVWEVSAATGANWDLDPLERIKRVTVQYLNVDSTLGEVTLNAPDAANIPDDVFSELKGSLQDNQTDSTLATLTAWRTLNRFLEARYRGRIGFVNAYEEGSRRNAPFEVRGGDLIRITDFSLDGSITLRVADVEYGPGGVTVGIEAPALPLGGSIRGSATVTPIAVSATTNGTAVYAPPGWSSANDLNNPYTGPQPDLGPPKIVLGK